MGVESLSDELIKRFLVRVSETLPGRSAHRRFTPTLAYGRHLGPPPVEARRAAVAIVLCTDVNGDHFLPLTVRPFSLRHHGGQVCLPGGRIEPGESAVEAAVREFQEELGPGEVQLKLLGILTPLYVYASNNVVTPVVMFSESSLSFEPDPIEVEQVVNLPLSSLAESSTRCQTMSRAVRGSNVDSSSSNRVLNEPAIRWSAPYWSIGEHRVWGATAMILSELAAMIHDR